jgi:hypothetical protein
MVCWPPSPSLVASPLKANTSANSPSSLSAPQCCLSDAPHLRNHKSAANVSDKLLRSHALTVICRSLIKRLTLAAAFAAAFFMPDEKLNASLSEKLPRTMSDVSLFAGER